MKDAQSRVISELLAAAAHSLSGRKYRRRVRLNNKHAIDQLTLHNFAVQQNDYSFVRPLLPPHESRTFYRVFCIVNWNGD